MSRFINREFELNILEERYKNKKPEFIIIYGRRRIGKTEIIKEFCKGKPHIYYLADKTHHIEQLKKIIRKVAEYFNERIPIIEDWEDFFSYLREKAKKRLIFIIDEFPYLIKTYEPILSIFQKGWDEYLKQSKIFIILCGSSVSIMEKKILEYTSPLYGRRTGQLRIQPLRFLDIRKFFPKTPLKKQIEYFSIAGRIPFYLTEIEPKQTMLKNILNIVRKDNILFEEPEFLLREELREVSIYSKIFEEISYKSKRLNDIAIKIGIEPHKLSKYINTLLELDYLVRIHPITEKPKTKQTLYEIKDNFFRFWYTFIYPYKSDLEIEEYRNFINNLNQNFESYVGRAFESLVREDIIKNFDFQKIGRWWGYKREKEERKVIEIDVIGLNEKKKEILFCECKWRDNVDGSKVLRELKEKARYVQWFNNERKEHYYIFARKFKRKTKEGICIDLKDLEKALVAQLVERLAVNQ